MTQPKPSARSRGGEIRAFLRTETAESHRKLDALVAGSSPFQSGANYQHYLRAMRALYFRFAEPLDKASQCAALPPSSSALLDALGRDLQTLGDESILDAPRADCGEESWCWGVAYTLEGSALGARFMTKDASLVAGGLPMSFLTSLANQATDRWPHFLDALEQAEIDAEPCRRGAVAVFEFGMSLFDGADH